MSKKIILFQGDSITDCGRNRNEEQSMGSGYPMLIKAQLGADYPNDYVFYNRGCGGEKITDLYSRINGHVINIKPDYMSILVGINDIWHGLSWGNGTGFERFEKIYDMYIQEIKAELPNTKIMIMEPFVLKGNATFREDEPSYWESFYNGTRQNAEIGRKIAEKYNLKFIELQRIFDESAKVGEESYWLSDGVHPTPMGHELIKREWIKAFNELK